ncbi:MAG: hypothetical protein ACT4OK_22875 [Gemmobacter sp.]
MAFLFGTMAAQAGTVTYQCSFPPWSELPVEEARATVNEADGAATVTLVGRRADKTTFEARAVDGAGRRTIRWSVNTANSAGQRARIDYSLILFGDGRKPVLRAKPFGYVNDFSAKGTCTLAKG